MKPLFAQTSNVDAFLKGITTVEDRGAPEASWMLVEGIAGAGKSKTLEWFSLQNDALHLRCKVSYTPKWFLGELVTELGIQPKGNTEDRFKQAVSALAGSSRIIIVDEIDHALHHESKVLETIRDLTDLTEVVVIVAGMEGIHGKLARYPQISSRISEHVEFLPPSVEDVRTLCDTICEVTVADDLIAEIHRQSGGRMRLILNAIRRVEQFGKRNTAKKIIALDDVKGRHLTEHWQDRRTNKRAA